MSYIHIHVHTESIRKGAQIWRTHTGNSRVSVSKPMPACEFGVTLSTPEHAGPLLFLTEHPCKEIPKVSFLFSPPQGRKPKAQKHIKDAFVASLVVL